MKTALQCIRHFLKEKIEELKREILYHQELRILSVVVLFFASIFLLARVFTVFSVKESKVPDSRNLPEKQDAFMKRQTQKNNTPIYVYITGAVENPGVYRLRKGSRLFELLEEARPLKDSAAHLLNQAQILEDGEMIYIPTKNEASQVAESLVFSPADVSSGSRIEKDAEKIDINSADEEDLVKIPGVGIKTAQKIIELRRKKGKIRSLEELLEIEGIGEKKLEKMKAYVKF